MFDVDCHYIIVHVPRTSIEEQNTILQQVKPVSITTLEIVYSEQYGNLIQEATKQSTLNNVI